jgi:hypothetical protein
MNLVKAQALANDLPITELKKYADGFDPRIIPPWIATGTLQAKMDLNKRMQNMTGGAQGEQPSIKEQIEQKAGLMAANNMQQQQQQQQMAMAQRPGPVPAGIPQPEDQPEAPAMMARGGLTSVPVRFAFKPGGIVGYSNGGDTMGTASFEEQELSSQAAELGRDKERRERAIQELERKVEFLTRAGAPQAEAARAQLEQLKTSGGMPAPEAPARQLPPQRPASVSEAQATAMAGPQAAVPPRRVERPAPRPEAAPRPAAQPAQTGLPAAASRSPYFAQADAALNEPNVKPTPQSIIAEQNALSPQAMLEENMRKRYEERKARADQERATFEKTRPSGLDDLIRVWGQAAQYKGGTGLAPAYTANQDRKRAEEMALEKRMNELYTAADTQEYEGAKEIYGARAKSMDAANRSYQERLKSRAETLAQLANVDERRIQSELDRLSQMEIAKIRAADAGSGDMKYLAQYLALKAEGKPKEAAALLESFSLFKRGEPKPDPLESAMAKQYAEQLGSALQLPPGKLRDERMAGLKLLEQKIKGGGGGSFTVTAGGKTYDFPTKEAADKFKAEAGVQ